MTDINKHEESKNVDVVLINPPTHFMNYKPHSLDVSSPPMGLLYLASMLEKNNFKVSILDVVVHGYSLDNVISILKKLQPKVVGISAMTPLLQGALQIAQRIKNEFSNIKIGLGGPHISADPDFVSRHKCFDFGVCGEAEITFSNIVDEIIKGNPIKQLYFSETPQNLDELPFPARHLIDNDSYMKKGIIMSSRGCPYNCYYCSRPAIDLKVRFRSAENIVKEIKQTYSIYGGFYHFQDDTFTINKQKTLELCDEIIKNNLKIRWIANTRIDKVDEELIKKMAEAGCDTLVFGIEAGNENIRYNVVNKRFSNKQIKEVVKLCNRYKINADGFFMIGHPHETIDDIKDTLRLVKKLRFNIIGVSITTPFPGSKLYEEAIKAGCIYEGFIDDFAKGNLGQGYAGVYPLHVPKDITKKELQIWRRKILQSFYCTPSYILFRIKKDISSFNALKRDFKEGVNLFLKGSSQRSPYKKDQK